jgi:murein L,D-transpeptidase YcbB/YkuD
MAISITTSVTPTLAFRRATPQELKQAADDRADLRPGLFEVVGITVPRVQNDTSRLQTETQNGFIRTTGGTLNLNLVQEVLISNALSPCAQTVVFQHERGHVHDNENVMPQMDRALRADEVFDLIMVKGTPFPADQLQATKATLQSRIEAVFFRLTEQRVRLRDTRTEYVRMNSQLKIQCSGATAKFLQRGSVGHGVADAQMALNAHNSGSPLLAIDGVFGQKTFDATVAFQRANGLKPDGVIGPETRAKLGLPAV